MSLKPVCAPCQRFFRPSKNGFCFIEGMPTHNGAEPGLAEPENWKPYKLWMGDQWKCEGCGAVIIVGTGFEPIDEHYKPSFQASVAQFKPQLQVNDC